MEEEEIEISLKKIDNYDLVTGSPIPPIDRLRVISADEYEACIAEWCVEVLFKKYKSVKKLGGAGDKGRDIVCTIDDSGRYDNYQCKHYASKLAPANLWTEFGKIIYYTYRCDFKPPVNYYFVSPQGLSPKMYNLLNDKQKLKKELIENWNKYCESEITSTRDIPLTQEIEEYINKFDFNIFKELTPSNFIEQYKKTKYFAIRFGGGLSKFRIKNKQTPHLIAKSELVYIQQLLEAYSEYKMMNIKTVEELHSIFPDLFKHLQNQRKNFYSAESLHRFIRDSLPDDNLFIELKDDIYEGLLEVISDDYDNGYIKVKETLKEVCKIQLSSIIIAQPHFKFSTSDRKGICHQLVNDEVIKWVENDI